MGDLLKDKHINWERLAGRMEGKTRHLANKCDTKTPLLMNGKFTTALRLQERRKTGQMLVYTQQRRKNVKKKKYDLLK